MKMIAVALLTSLAVSGGTAGAQAQPGPIITGTRLDVVASGVGRRRCRYACTIRSFAGFIARTAALL